MPGGTSAMSSTNRDDTEITESLHDPLVVDDLVVAVHRRVLSGGGNARDHPLGRQASALMAISTPPPLVSDAMGSTVVALVSITVELTAQIDRIEIDLAASFDQHPDAEIIRSLPGLGMILGARVLAEFGDDPNRYADAKSRKNYAGTSPITRPPARATSCWPATPATSASPTPVTCGRSPPSPAAPGPEPSTTNIERRRHPQPRSTGSREQARRHPPRFAFATTPPTTNTPHGATAANSLLDTNHPWMSRSLRVRARRSRRCPFGERGFEHDQAHACRPGSKRRHDLVDRPRALLAEARSVNVTNPSRS